MKTIIAAGIFLSAAAPAVAGPYANIENNASWKDSEFGAGLTEVHAGYEFGNGIYVQGGPAFVSSKGVDGSTEYSGKLGFGTDLSTDLNLYGEVSFLTEEKEFDVDQLGIGTKVGVTYKF
tara:strand:- start:2417 stop:2776 length:360 start_codon:yes stop_codon:yes gene_type:complete